MISKCHRLFVTRNAAAVIAVIEIPCVASDALSLQGIALEELRVIIRKRMTHHFAEWRLQNSEQDRRVRNSAGHRPGRVLLVTDWNNSILRDKSERRFQTDNAFDSGRTGDRSVGFGSDGNGAKIRRRARSRTGA